jgi:hypothetical protein
VKKILEVEIQRLNDELNTVMAQLESCRNDRPNKGADLEDSVYKQISVLESERSVLLKDQQEWQQERVELLVKLQQIRNQLEYSYHSSSNVMHGKSVCINFNILSI